MLSTAEFTPSWSFCLVTRTIPSCVHHQVAGHTNNAVLCTQDNHKRTPLSPGPVAISDIATLREGERLLRKGLLVFEISAHPACLLLAEQSNCFFFLPSFYFLFRFTFYPIDSDQCCLTLFPPPHASIGPLEADICWCRGIKKVAKPSGEPRKIFHTITNVKLGSCVTRKRVGLSLFSVFVFFQAIAGQYTVTALGPVN